MPVIIQVTTDYGDQRWVNANKILYFNKGKTDEFTWLDVEDGGFFVKETPEEIDSKIDNSILYIKENH